VNIAQRLQSEAAGGEIVAAASTVKACGDIDAESIGSRSVKGREEPVEVYRILVAG
jgi:class 3 adenylate cyclase